MQTWLPLLLSLFLPTAGCGGGALCRGGTVHELNPFLLFRKPQEGLQRKACPHSGSLSYLFVTCFLQAEGAQVSPGPWGRKVTSFSGRGRKHTYAGHSEDSLLPVPRGPRSGAEMRGKDLGIQALTADCVTPVLTGDNDQYLQISQ